MAKAKINITDQVVSAVFDSDLTVNEALASVYQQELADRRQEDSTLAQLSPLQIAMMDAGITKATKLGDIMNGGTITTQPEKNNEWMIPFWMDTRLHEAIYGQDILSYIITGSIGVDSTVLKAVTIDLLDSTNKPNVKRARVAEGADLPLAKIKTGEQSISLYKHGRAVELTYEAMKRMRIDEMGKILDAIAMDVTHQEYNEATDILLNGDGNSNAATQIGSATATANTLTAAELTNACVDYYLANNYPVTTAVMPEGFYKSLIGLRYDTRLAEGANSKFMLNFPQVANENIDVLVGDVSKVGGKNVVLLFNKQYALTKYVENGSMIREYQGNIRNQTRLGTISDVSGFAKFMNSSVRYILSA